MIRVKKKTQSFLEYSLFIAIFAVVLLVMQNYLKQSIQGKIQKSGDELSSPYHYGSTKLYERAEAQTKTKKLTVPGPKDITKISQTYNFSSKRELKFKP